jgi:hypothetical protein
VSGSRSIRAALAAAALGLCGAPTPAAALTHGELASVMDSVFGRGAWRLTGGYRTPAREDQLRAQGAMTVRPGGVSRHSLGRPGAPGAYDVVVDGMSPGEAANRLRKAGAPFARYQPKGAHGTQGPHLHLEPYGSGSGGGVQVASSRGAEARVEESRARSVVIAMPGAGAKSLAAARQALADLRARAVRHDAQAQLELGRAYATGYLVPRDFLEAAAWLAAAAKNPAADPELRVDALATLAQVADLIDAERAQRPDRYASLETKGR